MSHHVTTYITTNLCENHLINHHQIPSNLSKFSYPIDWCDLPLKLLSYDGYLSKTLMSTAHTKTLRSELFIATHKVWMGVSDPSFLTPLTFGKEDLCNSHPNQTFKRSFLFRGPFRTNPSITSRRIPRIQSQVLRSSKRISLWSGSGRFSGRATGFISDKGRGMVGF